MLAFLLGLFRKVWLFGKDHRGVVLENLALRQQLSIYKRKHQRPRIVGRDRWFWITLFVLWKDWRWTSVVVQKSADHRSAFRFGGDSNLGRGESVVARTPSSRRVT